jgi:hypothetical protein
MSRAAPLLFHEAQPFRLRRVRLMVAILPVAMSLLLIWQVILGHPWGKQPMSNGHIIGWTVFLWLVYLRLMTVRLVTDVSPAELRVTMRGLWRQRRIPLGAINTAEVVTYHAARDWGGYGIRTTRRGAAYIADGNRGVMLKLVKGGAILIGSTRPEELRSALNAQTAE